jgi:hypothetical protein
MTEKTRKSTKLACAEEVRHEPAYENKQGRLHTISGTCYHPSTLKAKTIELKTSLAANQHNSTIS